MQDNILAMSKKKSAKKPLVSVIIPAYNHEAYIKATLASVLGQTLPDLEVILIDDGSTDNTLEKAKAVNDPRLRVISQKNQGTAKALNKGLKLAQGTFLAILNSDDLYPPTRLELMTRAMQEKKTALAFSQVKLIDAKGQAITSGETWEWLQAAYEFYDQNKNLVLALIKDNFVCTSSNLVFHRSLLKKIGGFSDLHYVNDLDFILRAMLNAKSNQDHPGQACLFIQQPLLCYRIHPQNTIKERSTNKTEFQAELSLALANLFAGKTGPGAPRAVIQLLCDHYPSTLPGIAYTLQAMKDLGKIKLKTLAADQQFRQELREIIARSIAKEDYQLELEDAKVWLTKQNQEQGLFINQLQQGSQLLKAQLATITEDIDRLKEDLQLREQGFANLKEKYNRLNNDLKTLQQELQASKKQTAEWQKKADEIWEARDFFKQQYENVLASREYQTGQALFELARARNIAYHGRQLLKLILPPRAVSLLKGIRNRIKPGKSLQVLNKGQKQLQRIWHATGWLTSKTSIQQPYQGPLLTVITPCYNHGSYLDQWLASLEAQTWQNFEVILINDGSTDPETIAKIKELEARKIANLKILHQENTGVIAARNRGIKASQGKYIFPLDADDTIDQTFLEKCIFLLENSPAHYFAYTWTLSKGSNTFVWETRDSHPLEILQENRIGFAVFPKKALEECGGYDSIMQEGYEDWELAVRLVKLGYVGKAIAEPLYHYKVQPGSRNDKANQQRAHLVRLIHQQHGSTLQAKGKVLKKKARQRWKVKNGLLNLTRPPRPRGDFLLLDLLTDSSTTGHHMKPDVQILSKLLAFASQYPGKKLLVLAADKWQRFFLLNPRNNLQIYTPGHYLPDTCSVQNNGANNKTKYFLHYLQQRYQPTKIQVSDLKVDKPKQTKTAILYLAPWVITGGADQMTVDWFELLPEEKFAKYLVLTEPSSNEWLLKIRGKAQGIYNLPELGINDQEEITEFCAQLVAQEQIAILQIMNSEKGYAALPTLKTRFPGLKTVAQLHCFDHLPNGDLAGYPRDVPLRYDNYLDCYNVVSQALKQEILDIYPHLDPQKFRVVYCGINSTIFAPGPRPKTQSASKFEILFIGRLDVQKQPLRMAEIGLKLRQQLPDLDFVIHVLGAGSLDSQEKELQTFIKKHGLQKQILIHGPKPREDMPKWYSKAQCLLMTSKWEGIPVVLYEAMSMGVPCIAPDVGGIKELLLPGCGILVPGDAKTADYVQAISQLAQDPFLRDKMATQARTVICKQFDLQRTREGYLELYQSLLARD